MVWLVQNCRSNKCLYFLKPPELPWGLAPPGPLSGLCPGPAGDRMRTPDPPPTHAPLPPPPQPQILDPPLYITCHKQQYTCVIVNSFCKCIK